MPDPDAELLRQAIDALERASREANGPSRYFLLGEALRLYRQARGDPFAAHATTHKDAGEEDGASRSAPPTDKSGNLRR